MMLAVASEAKLVGDVLGDFAWAALLAIDQHVGLSVEGFAFVKELLDFRQWIRGVQERPMGLMRDAPKNRFRRGPKAGDQGMAFDAFEVRGVHDEAAASRDDAARLGFQFADDVRFHGSKFGFAFVGENLRNLFFGAFLDEGVGVDEAQIQHGSEGVPNGRFARAHETDEGDISIMAHPGQSCGGGARCQSSACPRGIDHRHVGIDFGDGFG